MAKKFQESLMSDIELESSFLPFTRNTFCVPNPLIRGLTCRCALRGEKKKDSVE